MVLHRLTIGHDLYLESKDIVLTKRSTQHTVMSAKAWRTANQELSYATRLIPRKEVVFWHLKKKKHFKRVSRYNCLQNEIGPRCRRSCLPSTLSQPTYRTWYRSIKEFRSKLLNHIYPIDYGIIQVADAETLYRTKQASYGSEIPSRRRTFSKLSF